MLPIIANITRGIVLRPHKIRGSRPWCRGAIGTEVERQRCARVERHRREDRGAKGAEGGRVWEGCPLPTRGGAVTPPRNFFSILNSKRQVLEHPGYYFLQLINLNGNRLRPLSGMH